MARFSGFGVMRIVDYKNGKTPSSANPFIEITMNRPRIATLASVVLALALAAGLTACENTLPPTDPSATPQVASPAMSRAAACQRSELGAAGLTAAPTAVLANGGSGRVTGSGTARVTDINGAQYPAHFAFSAGVSPQGTARGSANFQFGPDFAAAWAVAAGGRAIHVRGQITSYTEGGDGAVTLGGSAAIETEIFPGTGKVVFTNEPFGVVITGANQFTFWWCEVPPFQFEVASGQLSY